MKVVYVAGPIRPVKEQTLEGNLTQAKEIALHLWQAGFAVICPHANTFLDDTTLEEKENSGVRWIDGDLEMIARVDAVVVCPGWETSRGTKMEIAFAEENGIPVHYWPEIPRIAG